MKNITKALVVLLCLVLVAFSVISCGKDPADTTAPDTTVPDVTTPEETTPEETDPEVTVPEETDPEVTLPEETLPDETLPDETLPDETLPGETEPEETKPADTTKPAETTGPHKHEYQVVEKYPTCDADGTITYICACGDSYEEPGEPAVGHAWIADGEPTKSATPCLTPDSQAYKCVSCGATEVRQSELVPHDFTVSTQLVSAADDPLGKGYEILACSICDLHMTKVTANHVDGHYFVETEDGFACACGAIAVDAEEIFGVNNAEGKAEIPAPSYSAVGGKLLASVKGQHSIQNSLLGDYMELLSGMYEGSSLPSVSYSFELSYTGTAPTSYGAGGSYFSWRSAPSNRNEVEFNLTDNEGKLVAAKEAKAILEPNEPYTFTVTIIPEIAQISLTVTGKFAGEDGQLAEQEIVLVKPKTMTVAADSLASIYYGRDGFNHENTETFALYMDNFTISYVKRSVDLEGVTSNPCEHAFESERLIDLDHPLDEMWVRDTCAECERILIRQDCTIFGGHIWGDEPIRVAENDCQNDGSATYQCLACGETEIRTLPAEHNYYVFAGIVPAADDIYGVGYELWGCPGCKKLVKVEANHETGHYIDENGACKCGAVLVHGLEATLGINDFDTVRDITVSGGTIANGVWSLGNTSNGYIYRKNNDALAELLSGRYDGKYITEAEISFDLKLTGPFSTTTGGYALQAGFESKINFGYATKLNEELQQIDNSESNSPVSLKLGQTHRYTTWMDVAGQKMARSLVDGVVQKQTSFTDSVYTVADFSQVLIYASRFFGATVEIDNLSVDYVYSAIDETGMQKANCEAHTWTAVPVEGEDLFRDTCDECGYYLERVGCDTAGHTWAPNAEEEKTVDPSCTEIGYEYYPCIYCDAYDERELKETGHDMPTEPTRVDPATCDVDGTNYYVCNNGCGHEETEPIPAPGHDWDDGKITTPYNCVQPGVITYTCTVCTTATKTEDIPMGHAYVNFEGIVSKADDPRGVGYELYSCSGCHEAKKIAANHESGHFFDENSKCACGATLDKELLTLAGTSFTGEKCTSTMASGAQTAYAVGVGSGSSNPATAVFSEVLGGAFDGKTVTTARLSWTFRWTGDTTKIDTAKPNKGADYFSWRFNNAYDSNRLEFGVDASGDKVKIYKGANAATLEKDTTYTIALDCDIAANTATLKVIAQNGEVTVLATHTPPSVKLSTTWMLYVNAGRSCRCDNTSDFAIYLGDLSINVLEIVPDESKMATAACEHAFTRMTGPEVDRLDCDLCEVFYTEEGCAVLEHVWAEEPYESNVTCEGGSETYKCLICGADDVRELESADHKYEKYVSTTAATETAKGYETWQCIWCPETETVEGNHYTGHTFDENNACACGATKVLSTVNVAFDDFSGASKIGVGNHTVLNGELAISKVNSQGMNFSTSGNPAFAELYKTGKTSDGTPIEKLILSFDIKYTGDFKKISNNTFNWRGKNESGANYDEFTVGFNKDQDQLRINVSGVNFTPLTEGVSYRLAVEIDPTAKTLKVTLDDKVLREATAAKYYDTFFAFYLSRTQFYCENAEEFLLSADNMSVDYVVSTAKLPE